MRSAHLVRSVVVFIVAAPLAWSAGCGSNTGAPPGGPGDGGGSGGSGSGGGNFIVVPEVNNCTINNQCITMCADSSKHTTISGTVYDPAGRNPLPNVAVYVPASVPLAALPHGASCGDCNNLYKGTVLASDITKADGTFSIIDAPAGTSIPLVVQAGKWRMQYSVGAPNQCADNKVTQQLRLPKNATEGNLPDIAVSTGGLDSLECLMTRIGVDTTEYANGANGPGHIHIFQGGTGGATTSAGPTFAGGSPASYQALWQSTANLLNYDVVLLSCEGDETSAPNPKELEGYVKGGGRVFASHFHYKWFTANGSPFLTYGLGQFRAGSYDTGDINAVVDTSFAQGQALHDWLALPQVAALTNDQLPIKQSRQNVLSLNMPPTTSWLTAANGVSQPATPGLNEYFSFDIKQNEFTCGRVVYSDLHVGAASGDYGGASNTTGGIVPDKCNSTGKLSPQEVVLEYMLFNLSSCLTPVTVNPPPPQKAR